MRGNIVIKTYSEMMLLPTWQERLDYLYIGDNKIGDMTFGGHRWLNQTLYGSPEWKRVRRDVLVRDNACDLSHPDYPLPNKSKIIIHHINPITIQDLLDRNPIIFDMNNLVSVSFNTHQMIHYGTNSSRNIIRLDGNRHENDTKLW